MQKLFSMIRQTLSSGCPLVLVTVVASSGATPRGAGARMLVGSEGRICGTIGGGAVEYRSVEIAQQVLRDGRSSIRDFSLTKDDVQNLGMICGGAVEVHFHFLSAGDSELIALAHRAEGAIQAGEDLWLITDIKNGGRLSLYSRPEGFVGAPLPRWLTQYCTRHSQRIREDGLDLYIEQISSSGRVYIFGGGHVAQELVPVLSRVGFRCVVLDDRPEFTDPALFPGAEAVMPADFNRIGDCVTIGSQDYVCVMTRGHAYDTIVQAQILPLRPCYVGVIGSKMKAAGVRRVLKEEYGLSDTLLDQVITPIGLDILAETPAEIAISIAAQMIAHRARGGK